MINLSSITCVYLVGPANGMIVARQHVRRILGDSEIELNTVTTDKTTLEGKSPHFKELYPIMNQIDIKGNDETTLVVVNPSDPASREFAKLCQKQWGLYLFARRCIVIPPTTPPAGLEIAPNGP